MCSVVDVLEKFMNALAKTDTVKCILTGVGEDSFETKEIYMAIREEIYRARGRRVNRIDKTREIWVGTCPKCGQPVVRNEKVQNCGNRNCKEMLYWE